MDYDLARLGTREFEHLTQALVLKVLGARIGVFGDGPDGGRDATYSGRSTIRGTGTTETWDGYHVVQAKFRQRPQGTQVDGPWFLRQLKTELDQWVKPDSRRRKMGRLPDYLVLTTNVVLSSTEGGGVDAAEDLIARYAEDLGVRGWMIWHHDHICRLLDDAADIRTAFCGLLTVGDVLSQLHQMLQGHAADLGETLTAHVAKDLLAGRWVRLSEAGQTNEKLSLEQVAVDLPAQRHNGNKLVTVPAVAYVVGHGDQVLRPSITGTDGASHLVLVGGPGQGKTTLGQLITQTYRASLLEHPAAGFGQPVQEVMTATRHSLDELGVPHPASKRWPIRVELAAYAEAVGSGGDLSLLRWIAQQVTARSGIDVTPAQLGDWLKAWPWLLVLDGLDEVASIHTREHVIGQVEDFLVDAAQADADLLVVATTRPQGYGREFNDRHYEHLTLRPLSAKEATHYAQRLADVRHRGDEDLHRRTLQRVKQAATEPLTARLMRTPLQVTIMSLLLERRSRPPQDRHSLFEAYFDTIYSREVSKPGFLAHRLEEHRADVHALHEQIGLRLQVLAESEGEPDASLPVDDLRSLAVARLIAEGHSPQAAGDLADVLVRAAMHRLVLLVPKRKDEVGFEVRSLQEFMAARAIGSGTDEQVLPRLRLTAPAIHWRNTWLLAAGRIFATREHLRSQVIAILREVDADNLLAAVIPTGPALALDLLDDDLAARSPQFRRQLLQHALALLEQPPVLGAERYARTLVDLGTNTDLRPLITAALEQGISAAADRRATTYLLLQNMEPYIGPLPTRARQLRQICQLDETQRLALIAWATQSSPAAEKAPTPPGVQTRRLADYITDSIKGVGLTGTATEAAEALLSKLREIRVLTLPPEHAACLPPTGVGATQVREALAYTEVADALALALLEVDPLSWPASSALRLILRSVRERQPVGRYLLNITPSSQP